MEANPLDPIIYKKSRSCRVQVRKKITKQFKANWNLNSDDDEDSKDEQVGDNPIFDDRYTDLVKGVPRISKPKSKPMSVRQPKIEKKNSLLDSPPAKDNSSSDTSSDVDRRFTAMGGAKLRTFFSHSIKTEDEPTVKAIPKNITAMSIVPLLTEINEKGRISFKVQMLRTSGKFTTMILVLNKEKHTIFIKDLKKVKLQKAMVQSIITGGNIAPLELPSKTIDIDNLFKVECCAYQRLTVFLHYKLKNKKSEKVKQIQFLNKNDMFAFLTSMCSVECSLFDAPYNQIKTSDLRDLLSVKLTTFNMARKGMEYDFQR